MHRQLVVFGQRLFYLQLCHGYYSRSIGKDSQTQLAQIASQLQIVRDQVVKTAEYIISDEQINVNIRDDWRSGNNLQYFRKMHVQEELKRFTALNAFILNAMIVRDDGETYSNNPGYEEYFAHYLRQPWFTEIVEKAKERASRFPMTSSI